MFKFYVVDADPRGVVGRCGQGQVAVGDVFTLRQRNRPVQNLEEVEEAPVLESEEPVTLKVVAIKAYGEDWGMLGDGMACLLVLEGTDPVAANDILVRG